MSADQQTEVGPGGVPKGSKTSEYYRTFDIPDRFENPEWFEGYQQKQIHPLYRPTSKDYGGNQPNVHTMPTHFHGKSQKFTNHLGVCGMPRNRSLNTNKDTSRV
ncbi:piercer of microtubule wall 1 protein-like [Watersipora subatra]|uniref:piercer of microtubule wall 1 protein-like n=1 Tax=Watersipora subatra TaxID=2589382 RepID=UPI00355C97FF